MNTDFVELLQLLNDRKAKYLVIGGYAYGFYAEPRYTKDIDIWVEASSSNARKVLRVLQEYGAPTENLSVSELAKPGLIYIFGVPPLRVDILNRVKGATFQKAYTNRVIKIIDKLSIPVVSKQTLIKLKTAAGRPQDKLDLINLRKKSSQTAV